MMNLCLVVISAQFGTTKDRETELMLEESKKLALSKGSMNDDDGGGCWEEMVKFIYSLMRKAKQAIMKSLSDPNDSNKVIEIQPF